MITIGCIKTGKGLKTIILITITIFYIIEFELIIILCFDAVNNFRTSCNGKYGLNSTELATYLFSTDKLNLTNNLSVLATE